MDKTHRQVIIIGGGPAGLAAAAALHKSGVTDILILERERRLGGILNQCIHDGFGLTRFGETLSGPEYAQRFVDEVTALGIDVITNCTVIKVSEEKEVTAATPGQLLRLTADAIILTMGCRERPRGALSIPGDRPAGVFTAGVAQSYVNLKNTMVGKEAVILGSGDIGMIMARRLTLEGVKVKAVFELMPYPSGLPRNIEQCLNDYNIPLFLSHTVTRINGRRRLESVTVSQVDENLQPIPGTEQNWSCDTLILSVGLIPENELSLQAGVALDSRTKGANVDEYHQTTVTGVFAAGNVLHVHDLVDFVSEEAAAAGRSAAAYIQTGRQVGGKVLPITCMDGVRYTVPAAIRPGALQPDSTTTIRFRVDGVYTNKRILVLAGDKVIFRKKRPVLAPGEMETVNLKTSELLACSGADSITVKLEDA